MTATRCSMKDYKPSGDEMYICKKCKRMANKKSQLCKGKKVRAFLEKEKKQKQVSLDQPKIKRVKKKDPKSLKKKN